MTERAADIDAITRAAAVASDYGALQGLATVGLGVGAIVFAFFPPIGAAALVILSSIGREYYIARYGRVSRTLDRKLMEGAAGLALVALGALGVLGDALLHWPVLLTAVGAAAGLLCLYLLNYRSVGVSVWHYIVAALLALSALLPLIGVFAGDAHWLVSIGLFGVALIAIGLLDHFRLVAALRPVAKRVG